jgi:hypothetical protein
LLRQRAAALSNAAVANVDESRAGDRPEVEADVRVEAAVLDGFQGADQERRNVFPGDEYAVFVMEDDEPRLRMVTVGIMDYTSAEIISGLEAGEVVTTGVVETN